MTRLSYCWVRGESQSALSICWVKQRITLNLCPTPSTMLGGETVGKEVASKCAWQHRVFLASQYIRLNDPVDDLSKNDEAFELFGLIDNTSHQCSGHLKMIPSPDNKPLWWLVLRWLKMMLLKMARSYNAKPLLLIIASLFLGLCIGDTGCRS
jgi:hypothetical protein